MRALVTGRNGTHVLVGESTTRQAISVRGLWRVVNSCEDCDAKFWWWPGRPGFRGPEPCPVLTFPAPTCERNPDPMIPTDPEALGALMAARTGESGESRVLWQALEKRVGNWSEATKIWHLACPIADRIRRVRTPEVRRLEAALAARDTHLRAILDRLADEQSDTDKYGAGWRDALHRVRVDMDRATATRHNRNGDSE